MRKNKEKILKLKEKNIKQIPEESIKLLWKLSTNKKMPKIVAFVLPYKEFEKSFKNPIFDETKSRRLAKQEYGFNIKNPKKTAYAYIFSPRKDCYTIIIRGFTEHPKTQRLIRSIILKSLSHELQHII